jgi:hypothetical protein
MKRFFYKPKVVSKPEPEARQLFPKAQNIIKGVRLQGLGARPESLNLAYKDLEEILIEDPTLIQLVNHENKTLLMMAIEDRLDVLVELLIRYGAKVGSEFIASCIALDYAPTLIAKLLNKENSPEVENAIIGVTSPRIIATRFVTPEESGHLMWHIFVKAKALCPYYEALRQYYIEQAAFLSLRATKAPAQQNLITTECHARRLNSGKAGPLNVIFSFLRPNKKKYLEDVDLAMKKEPTAGLQHVIF